MGGDYIAVARLLIEHGADVNHKAPVSGATPLFDAAYDDHVEIARLLIEHSANVNEQSNSGITPLHMAAYRGQMDAARLLVAAGADLDIQDMRHETAAQKCYHGGTRVLLNDYQRAKQEAEQRTPIIAQTLAMATHERLGAESPLAVLDQNLLRHISQLTTETELHAARQPRQ